MSIYVMQINWNNNNYNTTTITLTVAYHIRVCKPKVEVN